MKAIEIKNLTKYYGKVRGIENVSLSVEEGEFFGFIGPNGAGKSTLIRTLLGLISANSGHAEIFGRDIVECKIENLKDIGYLPGECSFYKDMRVRDILKLAASARGMDCTEEAERLAKRLNLDLTRLVGQLSLGNKKKVGIIAALQHKPKLYILDEPTSGLDPLMQKEFFDILKERNRDGATVFLSSHILSEIKKYCDRAAIIREGSILLTDSVSNLASTGVKRVTLKGVSNFPTIEGVSGVKQYMDRVYCLYSGEVSDLIKALADVEMSDINISDPDLDEIFMNYYVKGDKT